MKTLLFGVISLDFGFFEGTGKHNATVLRKEKKRGSDSQVIRP
jgi:hypothetical protein